MNKTKIKDTNLIKPPPIERPSKSPDVDSPFSNNNNKKPKEPRKYSVIDEMEKMKQRREDRKKRIEEEKRTKIEMLIHPDNFPKLDTDYEHMISNKKHQIESKPPLPHTTSINSKIFVCVRKRPIFKKEIQNGEIDCITALNPKVYIYDCKMKIDGITKYIDTNEFYFDGVFNEFDDTESLYQCTVHPTIKLLLKGGVVTCFAYGQTGSGKTYTMKGIQNSAIDSLYDEFQNVNKNNFSFYISFFEIYSGRLYDLLNNRKKVNALEDKNQKVQIFGLAERKVNSPQEMKDVVDYANTERTTHNTVTNETSSRSHAICNFIVKKRGKKDDEYAKLTLVDLAGSERATETQSNNRIRLSEGAEINKSLLALKECIRALDARKTTGNIEQHVPFRTSKLTLVLRDSFISKSNVSKIIMISCISPGYTSANHTINTLRYADRLKEKTLQVNRNRNASITNNNVNNSNQSGYSENFLNFSLNSNNYRKSYNQRIKITKPQTAEPSKIHRINSMQNNDKVNTLNIDNNIDEMILNKLINEDDEEDQMQKLKLNPEIMIKPINKRIRSAAFKIKGKNKKERENNNNSNNNTQLLSKSKDLKKKKTIDKIDYLKITNDDLNVNDTDKKNYTDEVNYIKDDKQEIIPDMIEEQNFLISSHMNVLKDEAKLLTEEGNLISKINGTTENSYSMEEYTIKLEGIINKKLQHFKELKKKIQNYKMLFPKETNG